MRSPMPSIARVLLLIALLLASTQASAAPHVPAPPQTTGPFTHKAIVPAGVLDPTAPGVALWHDYGAFALYRITDEALAGLPPAVRRQVITDPQMDVILFDRHPLDTRAGRLDLPAELTVKEVSGPALHLVQFVGPIKQAWLDAVTVAGATPVQYIANNAYLVWADAAARGRLDSLARQGDFVQYSNPHQPGFKLGPSIERRILERSDPNELLPVEVQIYNHPGKTATQEAIRRLAVTVQTDWWPILAFENAEVTVRARDLLTIARLPDVVWLAERFPRELYDEVQGQIVAGHFDGSQAGPSGPGYLAWLDSLGFSQKPTDYPVVSVSDDGIGNGNVANGAGDSTFTWLGNGVDTRLAFITNCTTDTSGDGRAGHGHINTSIVGGYDQRNGFPFKDPNGFLRGLGINPYGQMAGTKVFKNSGSYSVSNCGGTDAGVIKRQQDNGALISTNSWGCSSCAGSYDSSSQAYDAGVRDADTSEPGNQQMTFIFSAGNSGSSSGTIGTPGNAKNVITVGASENRRPSDESGSWTDGCGIGPTGADNAMDVISFSSRGPAPGGRVKPETIAPGTHIQGTASTQASYDGSGVCDKYRPSGQTVFAASSGTSHSAPALAGVTSLYHYWLRFAHGVADPSPALIKAYVLAHPTYLTGVGANDTLPSNSQGYGMPNLETAFDDTPRALVNQTIIFDNSGETWTWTGSVADPSKPLRIVLNYTDAPGNTGTSPQVNNLNLSAVVNGVTYLGNRFSGRWSVTGGSPDNANNYEAIFLPPGTTGPVQITVTAFNIAGNGVPNVGDGTDQDFALVCYNCAATPDFTVAVTPATQAICAPADAVYTVNLTDLNGFADPVALSASGHPAGTTATFSPNPVTPPGSSTLTVADTGAAAAGTYTITVTGTSGALNRQATASLTVSTAAPAAPALTAPADGSVGILTTPTFTWVAAAQAVSYDLQVATDPAFANIVVNQAGLSGTSYALTSPLGGGTAHYWRVRPANACGAGPWSATWAFVTATGGSASFCRDLNLAIPDNDPAGVTDTQTVPASGLITDLDVLVQATHSWVGDLLFTVRNVGTSTSVVIVDRPGVPASTYGCSNNHINATLDDAAALPVKDQCAPSSNATPPPYAIDGTFQPNNPLSVFNGQELAGTWTMNVSDRAGADTGSLTRWCLIATYGTPLSADFSDLANSYGVAWHTGAGALRLGPAWTADSSFLPGADDASDDGISFPDGFAAGQTVTVRAGVQGTPANGRWLRVWFDWNADGAFGAGELAIDAAVSDGVNDFSVAVPGGLTAAVAYRARLYDSAAAPGGTATGAAAGGEVEDGATPAPCAAPGAVTGVAITALNSSEVQVTWSAAAGADHYEVWYAADAPYFTPGADCGNPAPYGCAVRTTADFTHAVLGDPAANHSYVVRAVSACGGMSAPGSPRVGEFEFDLTPGTP